MSGTSESAKLLALYCHLIWDPLTFPLLPNASSTPGDPSTPVSETQPTTALHFHVSVHVVPWVEVFLALHNLHVQKPGLLGEELELQY